MANATAGAFNITPTALNQTISSDSAQKPDNAYNASHAEEGATDRASTSA